MMKYLSVLVLFCVGHLLMAQSPFCAPTYSGTPSGTLCINSVTVGSYVSDPTASAGNPDAGYTSHSGGANVDMCAGSTYNLKVNVSRTIAFLNNPGAVAYVLGFFDWNNDGELNGPNEAIHLGQVETSTSPVSFNLPGASTGLPEIDVEAVIDVPFDAASSFHFRIAIVLENPQSSCEEQFVGEMEDFKASVIQYGEIDKANEFIKTFEPVSLNLTLNNAADPIDWQVNNGLGYTDDASLTGLTNFTYTPEPGFNALRAYKNEASCITDTAGQSRAYSSESRFVKLGANEINISSSAVCKNDSVSTYHVYSNEKVIVESTLPTTTTYYTSPDTSLLSVNIEDELLDFSTLSKVCVNISSNAFRDLSLILQAPNGRKLILSKRNGTEFTPDVVTSEFCFSDSIDADFINGHTSNLSGTFNPAQSFDAFNGLNPSGEWQLFLATDYFENASHTINSWSMEFGHQTFVGWEKPDRYEDASLDSARVEVVVDTVFRANFESEHGNNDMDTVFVKVLTTDDVKLDELTMDDNNICPGATSVFRSTLLSSHENVYYEWYLNGVLQSGENEDTIQVANLNDGDVVKVVADVQNNCNTSKDSLSITVVGQVFQDAEISLSQNKSFPLCEQEDLQVTANISNGDPNFASEWLVNNVITSTNSANFTWTNVSNNDSLIYNYTQTNACGQTQTFSDTIVYEGTPREDIFATMNVNNGVVFCQEQELSFFVTVNDANIPATYTWLLDGVDINNNANGYTTNSIPVGSHTIDVVYEPNGGCYNQENTVATVDFAIDPIRNTNLEIGGKSEFCENENLVFSIKDSAFIGSGALYQWFENGVKLDNETNPNLSLSNPVEGNSYTLEATSEFNCASPSIVQSNALTPTAVVLTTLDASFENQFIEEYCKGNQLQNTAVISGDASITSAQWNLNGNFLQDGVDLDFTLSEGENMLEFVVEFDRGCNVTDSKTISAVFTVFAPADTLFEVIQNSTEYTVNLINAFDETSTSYSWSLNNEFISNDAEPIFELIEEGNYTICMETTRGQSEICPSSKCIEFIYIGIDDVEFSNGISLYPNPVRGQLVVSGNINPGAQYEIVNAEGRVVLKGIWKGSKQFINTEAIEPGVYQVIISDQQKLGIKRFVKM